VPTLFVAHGLLNREASLHVYRKTFLLQAKTIERILGFGLL
jgi:hypothetical protein